MAPPIKKLRTLFSGKKVNVKEVVVNALSKDNVEARTAVYSSMNVVGVEEDFLKCLLEELAEKEDVLLLNCDCAILKEFFLQMGPVTACSKFTELGKLLQDNMESSKKTRNLTYFIGFFLFNTNLLNQTKLRSHVKQLLPDVCNQLASKEFIGEALLLAHILMRIIKIDELYFDQASGDVWKQIDAKNFAKSPAFTCLSALVDPSAKYTFNSEVFDEIPEGTDLLSVMEQTNRIIVDNFTTLMDRLKFDESVVLLKFVIKCEVKRGRGHFLERTIGGVDGTFNKIFYQVVCSAFFSIFKDQFDAIKGTKDVTKWISNVTNHLSNNDDSNSFMDSFIKKVPSAPANIKVPDQLMSVLDTFGQLSFAHFDDRSASATKLLLAGLASTFVTANQSLFNRCLEILHKLTRSSKATSEDDLQWVKLICEKWTPAVLENDDSTDVHTSIIETVASLIVKRNSSKDVSTFASIPLQTKKDEEKFMRICSYLLMKPWSSNPDHPVIKELSNLHIETVIKNLIQDEKMEEFSYFVSTLSDMPRAQRNLYFTELFPKKLRKKMFRSSIAFLVELSKQLSTVESNLVTKRLISFVLHTVPSLDLDEYSLEQLFNWSVLMRVFRADVGEFEAVVEKIPTEKAVALLEELSEKEDIGEYAQLLEKFVKATKLKEDLNQLICALIPILEKNSSSAKLLPVATSLIKLSSTSKWERPTVTLAFALCTSASIDLLDIEDLASVETLLCTSLKSAYSSVNEDQCAVFGQIVIKHFKLVEKLVNQQKKLGLDEKVENLVYGCAKIAHLITQHSKYYSRVVATIISETIVGHQNIELAMFRLHSISDQFSSAMLGTTLPPTEKQEYSRIFPTIKKAQKRIN